MRVAGRIDQNIPCAYIAVIEAGFFQRREAAENDLNVTRDRFLALGLVPTTLSDGLLEEVREIGVKYASRADFSKIVAKTVWKAGMEVAPDLMR